MYEPLGVQLTHILKTIFRGGKDMSKRTVCLILGLFLLSYIPATDFFEDSEESSGTYMDDKIERIEISPNPNSITDLGAPIITDSSESSRSENAESSIGVFTHSGPVSYTHLTLPTKA